MLAVGLAFMAHPASASPAAPTGHVNVDLAEEADLQFNIGVDQYRQGQYQAALEHLLASNRLVPNHNVVYNIARAYEQLGRFAEAYRHYADFAANEASPEARDDARKALDRIRPQVALVTIESTPPGATIYVDRADLGARGQTPATLAVPAGEHTILLEMAGFDGQSADGVRAEIGHAAAVALTLDRIVGHLTVRGEPAEAEIRLDTADGPVVGHLPASLDVAPGGHTLYLTAPGRRAAQLPVQVAARTSALVEAVLAPLTGTLVLDADESAARVEIDGRVAGFTPTVLDAVPVGRHRLRVSLPGYRPFEREVNLSADARVSLSAELVPQNQVTAASRTRQSLDDAPASVSIISHEELRAFGAETVYEALAGTRGVYQTNDGTYQALGFRGFSRPGDYGNRVLVQLDGHTMNDDMAGSSYVGQDFQTDLGAVERIEVVRGPGSALYGTNAFFGVINVVTVDRDALPSPQASVATAGDGHTRLRLAGGTRFGEKAGLWASASGARSGGSALTLAGAGAGEQHTRDADGTEAFTVQGKAFWGDFTLSGNFNRRDKRIPTGAFGTLLGDPRAHSQDDRGFVELRYDPTLDGAFHLSARTWLDHYAFRGTYPYEAPPNDVGVQRDRWDGLWTGAEVRGQLKLLDQLSLTAGAEGRVELQADLGSRNENERTLSEDARFQVYSGYLVTDFAPLKRLGFSLGARLDHFSTIGNAFSPRLATLIHPTDDGVLKLIVGQAFRAPGPYEAFYSDGGQTQIAAGGLQAETVRTLEAEYDHHLPGDIDLTGDIFFNQIAHLVDLTPVTSTACASADCVQYRNLSDRVVTLGAELEARRSWRHGGMLAATYAWQRTGVGGFDRTISNSPIHLVSLKHAVALGRTGATLANSLRAESGRLANDGRHTQATYLWDTTITGEAVPGRLSYGFGVRNLTNARVMHPVSNELAPVQTVSQPGRTVFATLTASY